MPTVLIAPDALIGGGGAHVDALGAAGFEIRFPDDPTFTQGRPEAETIDVLRGCEAIIAGGEIITARVLEALPELRVIARFGVGYDRVDVPAATDRGVVVTITPNSNHGAVAEHALALLFAISKNVVNGDRDTRAGLWRQRSTEPIRGRTLGIFGLGRIGRATALRARALGMRVLASDPFADADSAREAQVDLVDFETLLAESDVLSVHCPLIDSTRGLFDRSVFERMKPGAVLVNTSRGPIVVEADLVEALQSGRLSAAGLDVFEKEPPGPENPLYELENVVLSSHLAGTDTLSQRDMALEAAECIVALWRGEWPRGSVVNDSLRASWRPPSTG